MGLGLLARSKCSGWRKGKNKVMILVLVINRAKFRLKLWITDNVGTRVIV